jgi:hypothetical protein
MITAAQQSLLTAWHAHVVAAYAYGVSVAQASTEPGWWRAPGGASPADEAQFNHAADAAYCAHAQLTQLVKRQQFDAEFVRAVEQGLTDGTLGGPSFRTGLVWWKGYAQLLSRGYADGYSKAVAVVRR